MQVETDRSRELRELAQRVTDALPPDVAQEVIVTGSVSRGVADAVSDIAMLVVTPEIAPHSRPASSSAGRRADEPRRWGAQDTPARRVSGLREGVPVELIWWSREFAEIQLSGLLAGQVTSSADAIFRRELLEIRYIADWRPAHHGRNAPAATKTRRTRGPTAATR